MYTQDTVLRLVGRIYDAALNPREWATFATHLAETVNGHSCALWNVDPRHSGFGFSAVARFDPEAMTTFRRDYAHLDPWARALTVNGMWKDGVVGLGEAVVPQSMLHKTQFYNELGRHYGIIGGFGAISMTDSAMLAITMNQVKPGQFGKEEIHLMRELQPHLRRAITLNERLTRLETLQGAAADALDSFPTCVILLDGRGRPHTVNRAASRLLALGDGLRSTRDGLTADHPSETNVLRRLIHAALETTAG